MRPPARARAPRRLPQSAVLLLAALLAGAVVFLTWPTRAAIYCERLPELFALAFVAAALLVLAFRGLAAAAATQGGSRYIPGCTALLAGLSFFLAAHFIAQYRKPCAAVQQEFVPHKP